MRTIAYIDGFNLYHSLCDHVEFDPSLNYLKWLDLKKLAGIFTPPPQHLLVDVFYFSAFATWKPAEYKRHRSYIAALESLGVKPILGRFKKKDQMCFTCMTQWKRHEEKETDINIAIHMLNDAYMDRYDRALLFSSDSDFSPSLKMITSQFPTKKLKVITPYNFTKSADLLKAAGGYKNGSEIRITHLKRCLLPREIKDAAGNIVAIRPREYDPPAYANYP